MGRAVPMKSGLPAFLFHHESGSKELIGNLKSEITQVPRSSREQLRRPSRYNSARELTKSETDKRDNKHLLIESPAKAISGGKFRTQHEAIHRCLYVICRHQEVISGKTSNLIPLDGIPPVLVQAHLGEARYGGRSSLVL